MIKGLKDVSKNQMMSTTTCTLVAEQPIFISEKSKGKSENNLEERNFFSDSLPIFNEYDEELMDSLMICEDTCDLLFLESDLVINNEQTIAELTFLQPEHSNSLILFSQDFEEEPFDYSHQEPLLGTRKPLEDSRPKVFYQSKNVHERLGLIIFIASTKHTSLGRENDPNKFNLFWMKLKFDHVLYQNVSDPYSS